MTTDTVELDTGPTGQNHDDADGTTPRAPAGWPLTLQVAVAFWLVLAGVLAYAGSGGGLWVAMLALIAADYAWYLRTDEGLIVASLNRAPWNNPRTAVARRPLDEPVAAAASPPRPANAPVRLSDISPREMVQFAREEIPARLSVVTQRMDAVTTREKVIALRMAVAVSGVVLALSGGAIGLAIMVLAALDWVLQERTGVSVAGLAFVDPEVSTETGAADVDGSSFSHGDAVTVSDRALVSASTVSSSGPREADDGLASDTASPTVRPVASETPDLQVALAGERASWRSAA